jgi:oxaloacetate decarboxylase alpha subunit
LLLETLGATPLQLHTRCQTALAPQVVIDAARMGVAGIDTALPCVANGASVPSLIRLARSLALLGIDADVPDMAGVVEADRALAQIADAEGLPVGEPWVFDVAPYAHQLPGEIAAQVMDALASAGRLGELHAFAEECARVRAELGNPPMVAPFAGPIAAQAWQHFSGMARYAGLQPGLRRILLGAYGPVDGAFDRALQQRVGVLATIECKNLEDIRRSMPRLDDASRLLAHAFAVDPSSLPRASNADELTYRPASPWDRLALGLVQRSQRYALLSVAGPGVDIRFHQCKE